MKKNNLFWIGYSDLMTSLFFIMLVIAAISVRVKQEQINKIEELQTAVNELPEEYFTYQPQYKRFKLNQPIQFDLARSDIRPEYHAYLINVGRSINDLLITLNKNPDYKKYDIKYLIVIEGMASKDNYGYNFELSYKRSLELYKLWRNNGIAFDQNICEVQIAGSGTEGIREYFGDKEYMNQQFLIHIIPKMGKITEKE